MGLAIAEWARDKLEHDFEDVALLESALTHGSAPGASYQRLEFLGDRVLGFVIAEWLFREFDEPEGELAQRLAVFVDKATCAEVARAIDVPAFVRVETAARLAGVNRSDNVLGDVCEALIAALYLDGGMVAAAGFIRRQWAPFVDRSAAAPKHPKAALQEWALAKRLPIPSYEVVSREGPDHAPAFRVRVTVRGHQPAEAVGSSKQDAEKQAATELLARETGR